VSEARPPKTFGLARAIRVTVAKVLPLLFRTRVLGRERVPAGGVILAGNHVSYADPVLLWCESPRPVHFMAKSDLWDHGFIGWGLDRLWAFPVRRDAVDRAALTKASGLLKADEIVGIFPEGSRHAAEGESHGGAAFLSIHNRVPVVPVGIAGTERIWPKGKRLPRLPRVVFSFGEPIDPAAFGEHGHKERVGEMTDSIMAGIAREVEVARKGGTR
jgi:1-acyl-sn-glycerol-3-phosphate acyltransferase